jgi:hypothetical protein
MLEGGLVERCIRATARAQLPENMLLRGCAATREAFASRVPLNDRGPAKGPHHRAGLRAFRNPASGRIQFNPTGVQS